MNQNIQKLRSSKNKGRWQIFYNETDIDKSIDALFEFCNTSFARSDFYLVDELLLSVELERSNTSILVAALSITLCAKEELKKRDSFLARVEKHLKKTEPQRYKKLLRGLR